MKLETSHAKTPSSAYSSPENVIPGDFSRSEKKEKITEYEDFMECEDLAERVDFTACACVRPL